MKKDTTLGALKNRITSHFPFNKNWHKTSEVVCKVANQHLKGFWAMKYGYSRRRTGTTFGT